MPTFSPLSAIECHGLAQNNNVGRRDGVALDLFTHQIAVTGSLNPAPPFPALRYRQQFGSTGIPRGHERAADKPSWHGC